MMTWTRSLAAATMTSLPSLSKRTLLQTSPSRNTKQRLRFPAQPSRVVPATGSEKSIPLSCSQQPSPPAEVPELMFPAVPDPPSTSLSCSGGHTSGDPVVSTQLSAQNFHSPESTLLSEKDIDAYFAVECAAVLNQEENINASPGISDSNSQQSATTVCNQDPQGIPPTQIPGFRYSDCFTSRDIRLPFRIDQDPNAAQLLAPYLTLKYMKMEELYEGLGIDYASGKKLGKDLRAYIHTSRFADLVHKRRGPDKLGTKAKLLRAALHILASEGWGTRWFGVERENVKTRTMVWPDNSTLLVFWFVKLLDRVVSNTRQSLVLRTPSMQNPSPTESRQPSLPLSQAFDTTGSVVTRQPAQNPRPLLDATIKIAAENKKRKRADSIGSTAVELDIPDNARLTYYVYIRHKADGSDLSPPAVYRHTDAIIANDAFTYLKTSLENEGHAPVFEILTEHGVRIIKSEADWDMAVTGVYNRRRSGAIVEVDVFV